MAAALNKPRPEKSMLPLLTTDWHLTDNPEDEYRWAIIEHVLHAVIQYDVDVVFILGDIADRKDRHSGALVNRLVEELRKIAARAPVVILRGNHDTPLRGPAFWEFLSRIDRIEYITEPTEWHLFDNNKPDLWLLPFTATPHETWQGRFSNYRALFMHATVSGAVVENGMVMQNSKFPLLPRSVTVYSGDVHTPQTVGNVTYVGAPHPVKFGDRYPCRMLLLDEAYNIKLELPLAGMRKYMLDLSDVSELRHMAVKHGDQVKIRFQCPPGGITGWGAVEAEIARWAAARGVVVAGTEVMVDSVYAARPDTEQSPEQILRAFAAQERITKELLAVGLSLLDKAR
jgi:hypothetical protein